MTDNRETFLTKICSLGSRGTTKTETNQGASFTFHKPEIIPALNLTGQFKTSFTSASELLTATGTEGVGVCTLLRKFYLEIRVQFQPLEMKLLNTPATYTVRSLCLLQEGSWYPT